MSWFRNLAEAYDRVADIADVSLAEDGKPVLLPLHHMAQNTHICIALDGEGKFRSAEASALNIPIPCTEDSASRTSKPVPHPLHDNLGYLALDEAKRAMYLEQLAKWCDRHPKVKAVYRYIQGGTILDNLAEAKIDTKSDKLAEKFVRFCVEIADDPCYALWKDTEVVKIWQEFCSAALTGKQVLCYVTGEMSYPMRKHPKGINPVTNGAKLISSESFKKLYNHGRFHTAEEANAISVITSYKAHAMFRYLIETQGYRCGTQAVVTRAIDNGEKQADPFGDTYGLIEDEEEKKKTEGERLTQAHGELAWDYAKVLRQALMGKGNAEALKNSIRRVAVMAVDAATTGRMGITFYQDLPQNEYIERILAWHESCRWWMRHDKREILSAPSANRIIAAVYGEPRGEGYAKIQRQARERLLGNIVCRIPLDRGWVAAAVARVSHPFSYDKKDGGWDKGTWENAVSVTCAIVRKYYEQKEKGEISLDLDVNNKDRSYLFGRLLAIADRLESHARFLQTEGSDTEKRPTNAIRYMSSFAAKPLRTWALIYRQLAPYIQRLDGAAWYQAQIDEIMSLFESEDEISDKALNGKYLLGYSLQRREFFKNGHKDEENKEETTDELN